MTPEKIETTVEEISKATLFPAYFLQQQEWLDFWVKASGNGHQFFHLKKESLSENLQAFICQYPWFFGQKFLYLAKGPILSLKWRNSFTKQEENSQNAVEKEEVEIEFAQFLQKLIKKGKEEKAVFIKLDLDDSLAKILEIETNDQLLNLVQKNLAEKAILSLKRIQFLQSMVLDLREIKEVKTDGEIGENLSQFYQQTSLFWEKTNQKIRRYTRKAVQSWEQKVYHIDTQKTPENFQQFWQLHSQTSKRQNFPTQSREYLQVLFDQDFSRLILIKDQQNQVQSVFLGISLGGSLTYLLGGNTQEAFSNHTQYLLQLAAIKLALKEKNLFYDLGGWEEGSGYGQFKDGYRGQIRQFLGPIDIILQPSNYHFTQKVIDFGKTLRGLAGKR